MKDSLSLSYSELAVKYDLGSLKEGGDLSITPDGDLATTACGDLKVGDDRHNALHRIVIRWQMEAPVLASMFDDVLGVRQERQKYVAMIDTLLSRPALDTETEDQLKDMWQAIGISESGPGNCAGAIAVALNNMLRSEWVDLGKPATWETAGIHIAGHSFGSVIEAMANNFRHSDEWARQEPPTEQQLKSIRTIADVFGTTLKADGSGHPFRGNVCPKLMLIISSAVFEGLAERFFRFARALAGL